MLWEEKFEKIEEQFGGSDPARVVSDAHYQRTPFGTIGLPGDIQQFAPTVVSLALFDGKYARIDMCLRMSSFVFSCH
jgi:hypothetical protein